MKGLLKNLGLILILIGVVILLACSFTGNVNNNAVLGSSVFLVVLGLISYIVIKRRSLINLFEINKKSRERMFPGFFIFGYRSTH